MIWNNAIPSLLFIILVLNLIASVAFILDTYKCLLNHRMTPSQYSRKWIWTPWGCVVPLSPSRALSPLRTPWKAAASTASLSRPTPQRYREAHNSSSLVNISIWQGRPCDDDSFSWLKKKLLLGIWMCSGASTSGSL